MARFNKATDFGRELRSAGNELLEQQPTGRYADAGQWLRAISTIIAFIAAYLSLLLLPVGWFSLILAALCGFLSYIIVAGLCHDASHGSLSRKRWVNRAILFSGFAMVGVSGALWGRRHVHVHHMFPNVEGTDIDADSSILIRLSPHKPWRFWHRFQSFYAPILYTLVLPHLAWRLDFHYFSQARQESPESFCTASALAEFIATKAIHLCIAILLPWLFLELTTLQLALGYLIATGAASFLFVMINVGTHICDEADFVAPDAQGRIEHDWATHQAMTSVDWSPTSQWAVALTGGANAHAAHHLFPQAAHCHNAKLSTLVSEYARRFGRPHHVVSFAGMLASHWRHLASLSRQEASLD